MIPTRIRPVLVPLAAIVALIAAPAAAQAQNRADLQTTDLVSRSLSGGIPNGASGNSMISGDKRYARVITYESDASDLVAGDTNGQRDVFAVIRGGDFGNNGSPWVPGRTVLVSRTASGAPANGPSFAPSVDGAFEFAETTPPSCIAFLSAASNIVAGDDNSLVDAFVAPIEGGAPQRISPAGAGETTAVAVSGDCSYIAMVTGGRLYLYDGRTTRLISTETPVADPSFGVGRNQDLVFGGPRGVWRLLEGKSTPTLVAPGGRNPAYNDVKRQVVAYEKSAAGHNQVYFREIGESEKLASGRKGTLGNGDSREPILGNSGYALTFETDASNLGVNSLSRIGDENGQTDAYLYTDVRELTLVQSVEEKAVPLPGGGRNPSMSFYNNYITFDSPAPLGAPGGPSQVWMRYLGPQDAGDEDAGDPFANLPDPEPGKTANIGVLRGTVYYRPPGGSNKVTAAGSNGLTKLTGATAIPMGSTIDTKRGTVLMETAVGISKPGQTQTATFNGGQFEVRSRGGTRLPMTELLMNERLTCQQNTRGKELTAARRSRRLWGNGKGRYRTRGRNSSATVRGTIWLTKDSCNGTTTVVRQGTVVVRDFKKRKNITVKAPKRYTARAR